MADTRYLVIAPENIAFSVVIEERDVCMHLDLDADCAGRMAIAIRMTPTEARRVAETLIRKAGAAEAGSSRA
jgi:hypothetical protein